MRLTITHRLVIMITGAVLALLLVGGSAFRAITDLQVSLTDTNENVIPSISLIDDVQVQMLRLHLGVVTYVLTPDTSSRGQAEGPCGRWRNPWRRASPPMNPWSPMPLTGPITTR
ncbi:MCP four helix bundle domain-containing protein [Candidatus Dactylopiibacterium carminicum]|uniref:MCP four helix bundle domain-containing protein n=1 Tax=Candidatus Dactylopiibacterium carminicum TaxID=857335 RepID=UPI001140E161|nr:MCP four helix bundle domain-containing protein [Candidatus Dactylopiibacterium carminicum]